MEVGGGDADKTNTQEYLDEYSGDVLSGISIAFASLTTVFLGLRFYAKRFRATPFGLDDVFLMAAYFVNLGMCALGIVMVQVGGVGQHVEAVEERDPALLVGWAKTILAFEIIYFTSVALPKMAIVFLYLRVFNWKGTMRNLAITLQVILASTGLALVIAACFQCRPIAYWWDRSIQGGTCFDIQTFFHAQSIPGFVLDFFIMALPIRTIWGLKLPVYKRIALVMVFLVASFGIVASIIRAITFFDTAALEDRTWASVALVGWSIIETGTYIITACLPSLRPLISYYTPPWIKSMVRKTVTNAGSSLSKNYHIGRDEDQVELTARSGRKESQTELVQVEEREGLSNRTGRWDINNERDMGSSAHGFQYEAPNGISTEVRNSGTHMGETWGGGKSIRVKTEVKVERSPVQL